MRRFKNYCSFIAIAYFENNFFSFRFLFGRKPSNVNLEEGMPLETRAVIAAHGPGIHSTKAFSFTLSDEILPGSQC